MFVFIIFLQTVNKVLYQSIRYLRPGEEESAKVSEFKRAVSESLNARMALDQVEVAQKAAMVASFLDPRHKHLRFTTDEIREAVHAKVTDLLSNLPALDAEEDEGAPGVAQPAARPEKRAKHSDAMLDFFGDGYFAEDAPLSAQSELERYLGEDAISPVQDPSVWWELHEKKYKNLSRLANHYLCIPATSVPAERVFSAAGLILNKLRTRLTPEHVDMLLFLNKNKSVV